MKNKTKTWRLIAAIAVAVFAAACSDGELKLGESPNIAPPQPAIKFYADPEQVEAGQSTTLYWEVINATSIEISSAPESVFLFHAGPFEELTGSTKVDNLMETTEFVLTAYNTVEVAPAAENEIPTAAFVINKAGQIPLPGEDIPAAPAEPSTAPTTSSAEARTLVTVIGSSECAVDMTADNSGAPVNAGEEVVISWNATPDTAQVTSVTASDGTPVATSFPVSGSATVTPTATTTYTATIICPNGDEKEGSVTIDVVSTNVQANILVNGKPNDQVEDFTQPVTVTWTVEPEAAKVTVTAEPSADCEPALPADEVSANGTSSCTITAETTFTIEAELGSSRDADNADVTIQPAGDVNLDIKADPWAFVTEEVNINVQASASVAGKIEKVRIGNKETGELITKEELITGVTKRWRVPNLQGVDVFVWRTGSTEPEVQKPIQNIVPLEGHQFFHAGSGEALPVTRVTFDAANMSRFYYGVNRTEFGEISAYRLSNFTDSHEFAIDITDALKKAFDLGSVWPTDRLFREFVKTYPVNAIAITGEGDVQKLFASTTGLIMYSTDGGESWSRLDAFYYARRDGYSGSHKTCAGKMQEGFADAQNEGDIVALGQICDMIAKPNGRLIVAYDRGILVTEDAIKHAANRNDAPWIGARNEDTNGVYSRDGSKVAHDLEEANGKIFAATNSGVYVNESGDGVGWTSFAGGALDATKVVYAVAFDAKSDKVFAGADDGVYVSDVANANWVKTADTASSITGPVLSLAVDPAYNQDDTGPVVIAGLGGETGGVAVTRDGGEFWSKLNSAEATDLGEVRSLAIAAIVSDGSNEVVYKISAGGNGYAAGGVVVPIVTATAGDEEETPEDETPGEIPDEDGGDTVVGDDTGGDTDGDVDTILPYIPEVMANFTAWYQPMTIGN